MEFQTLKELYAHSIKAYGNRPSFSMLERESMTYNDFDDRVEYVRGILLGAGIGSGDKVALLSSNMPNWSVCYFAIVTSGMVAVPILPDFSGSEPGHDNHPFRSQSAFRIRQGSTRASPRRWWNG